MDKRFALLNYELVRIEELKKGETVLVSPLSSVTPAAWRSRDWAGAVPGVITALRKRRNGRLVTTDAGVWWGGFKGRMYRLKPVSTMYRTPGRTVRASELRIGDRILDNPSAMHPPSRWSRSELAAATVLTVVDIQDEWVGDDDTGADGYHVVTCNGRHWDVLPAATFRLEEWSDPRPPPDMDALTYVNAGDLKPGQRVLVAPGALDLPMSRWTPANWAKVTAVEVTAVEPSRLTNGRGWTVVTRVGVIPARATRRFALAPEQHP